MLPLLDDIRLIAFDLDGTLIDSVPDLAAAVDAMLGDLAWPPAGEAKVRDWVGNGSHLLVARALADAGGSEPDAATLARAHARFLVHYRAAPCARTRVFPGVREALEGLSARGLVLALITNKPAAFIDPNPRGADAARLFPTDPGRRLAAREEAAPGAAVAPGCTLRDRPAALPDGGGLASRHRGGQARRLSYPGGTLRLQPRRAGGDERPRRSG